MLFSVRPPKYKEIEEVDPDSGDPDANEAVHRLGWHPRELYIGLLVYHALFFFFSFSETFTALAKYWRFTTAVQICFTVTLIIRI